ncbi:histidine kinase dimerization/phospho-acceptor domain-containing protein [Arachidicoccus terrestris]|uniref:histidine kinase dimerization/phospho-acceptor domain-containing protein n=1 Tax=Arachidicoccus terrestris TaxID=2875539 RepID=UPI001CC76667|nr:histidine kinase dimerization/phospho-acceptor domain-containing protein [Arachidicoccus terrestris]UAY55911.1 hypothetical protein K9M52_02440 [Arachidicoccus terrestris]
MLDAHTHYEFQRLPFPMELLRGTCEKLAALWPDLRICVFSAEIINEEISEFKTLLGDPAFNDGLRKYSDILVSCMKDQKPYFHGSDLICPDLLAVLPFMCFSANDGKSELVESAEFSHGIHLMRKGVFCLWRVGNTTPTLDKKDRGLLDIVVEQLSLYNTLYCVMFRYSLRAKKLRHDLRTPLTSVTMIGGLLEQEKENMELREIGEMLHSASEKMDGLLNAFRSEMQS